MKEPRLVCLKCGGYLDRLPNIDRARCTKCKRTWDMIELHRARIDGKLQDQGVGVGK